MKYDNDKFLKKLFIMTNEDKNTIISYTRNEDGSLSYEKTYETCGKGLSLSKVDTGLYMSNSLIISPDRKYLFALNIGSNEISSFKIENNNLKLVGVSPSNGIKPNSMAILNNYLFVTNLGDKYCEANVCSFYIRKNGKLSAISYDYLPQKNKKSKALCITSIQKSHKIIITGFKTNNMIIYNIDKKGYFKDCKNNISNTPNPLSSNSLCDGSVLVSGFPSNSLALYNIDEDNCINLLYKSQFEGDYDISSLTLNCNNKCAYVTNASSSTLSTYEIKNNIITLRECIKTSADSKGFPIDSVLDRYSKFLYVLNKNNNNILSYRIKFCGDLVLINTFEIPLLLKSQHIKMAII